MTRVESLGLASGGRGRPTRGAPNLWRADGIALLVALLMLSIISVLALGLSLVVSMDPVAAANQREALSTAYVARAGLELAAQELGAAGSWDPWLSGASTSAMVDGAPSGTRMLPAGESIDIAKLTSQLTCGRDPPCTDTQMDATTRARPWGVNNSRWQPFLYGPTTSLGLGLVSDRHYLIVWVGDDGAERDGRPGEDGPEGEGGGVVDVVVQAFGPLRSRQTLEARVSRRCAVVEGVRTCAPGVRVHSWHAEGSAVP